jgi:hypothetical protein
MPFITPLFRGCDVALGKELFASLNVQRVLYREFPFDNAYAMRKEPSAKSPRATGSRQSM